MRKVTASILGVLVVALAGAAMGWQPLYSGPYHVAGQALAAVAAGALAYAMRQAWRVGHE